MAMNQRYTHFEHITLTADRDIEPGEAVRIGQVAGVSKTQAAKGERVTVWLDGSYDIEVEGALTQGQAVYIAADGALAATGDTFWGVAATEKSDGTGIAEVAPAGIITPTATDPADTGDGN